MSAGRRHSRFVRRPGNLSEFLPHCSNHLLAPAKDRPNPPGNVLKRRLTREEFPNLLETPLMKSFLLSSVLLIALGAGAAHAQSTEEIRIPVTGMTRSAINAEIARAAHRLCDPVVFDIVTRTSADTCYADSVTRAHAQLKALEATGAYATARNVR